MPPLSPELKQKVDRDLGGSFSKLAVPLLGGAEGGCLWLLLLRVCVPAPDLWNLSGGLELLFFLSQRENFKLSWLLLLLRRTDSVDGSCSSPEESKIPRCRVFLDFYWVGHAIMVLGRCPAFGYLNP